MFAGLTDRLFGVADGQWSMYRCEKCYSAFLDPRPTPESIGRAYANYYTHSKPNEVQEIGNIKNIMRSLMNNYINNNYGTRREDTNKLGQYLIPLIPPVRDKIDAKYRNINLNQGTDRRLLDVGCGNGQYLLMAREAGWDVEGVDFDHEAIRICKDQGLNVHLGGLDILTERVDYYDVITLSHVIEHVHEPDALLKKTYALLKPGGMLWLSTPNIDSALSRIYKENWRGLEPPRHLVLFNYSSLLSILKNNKFNNIRQHYDMASAFIIVQSNAIKLHKNNIDKLNKIKDLSKLLLAFAACIELYEWTKPRSREFLVISAVK